MFTFSSFSSIVTSNNHRDETMISTEIDKSKQVKAVAAKPTTKSSKDAKTNVKNTAKPKETKEEERKNVRKEYEEDEDDDTVCILDPGHTKVTCC